MPSMLGWVRNMETNSTEQMTVIWHNGAAEVLDCASQENESVEEGAPALYELSVGDGPLYSGWGTAWRSFFLSPLLPKSPDIDPSSNEEYDTRHNGLLTCVAVC